MHKKNFVDEEYEMSISGRGNGMFESLHLVRVSTAKDLPEDMCGWNMVREGTNGTGCCWRGKVVVSIFVAPFRTLDTTLRKVDNH